MFQEPMLSCFVFGGLLGTPSDRQIEEPTETGTLYLYECPTPEEQKVLECLGRTLIAKVLKQIKDVCLCLRLCLSVRVSSSLKLCVSFRTPIHASQNK